MVEQVVVLTSVQLHVSSLVFLLFDNEIQHAIAWK